MVGPRHMRGRMKLGYSMKGMDEWLSMTDPKRVEVVLKPAVAAGLKAASLFMEKRIKSAIHDRHYAPNAPLTVAMKNSSLPLVDTGRLAGSVSHKLLKWNHAVVGASLFRGGANVGLAVHDGFTVDLTLPQYAAMRKLLHAQVSKLKKGGFLTGGSMSPMSGFLVVPPRHFIKKPFNNLANVKAVKKILGKFVQAAMIKSAFAK